MAINIKPSHRGKFTARHISVSKGLKSKSGVVRQEANFARMAKRHWTPLSSLRHAK